MSTVTEQLSWQIIGINTGQVLTTWLVPGLFKRSGVTTSLSTTGNTAFFRELCLQWSTDLWSLHIVWIKHHSEPWSRMSTVTEQLSWQIIGISTGQVLITWLVPGLFKRSGVTTSLSTTGNTAFFRELCLQWSTDLWSFHIVWIKHHSEPWSRMSTVTEQLSWQIIGINTGQVLTTWLVPGLFKRSGVTTSLSTTGNTAFFRELCLQWSTDLWSLHIVWIKHHSEPWSRMSTVTEQLSWQIIGISTGQVLITWLVPGLFKRSGVTTSLSTTGNTAFFRELCLQWSTDLWSFHIVWIKHHSEPWSRMSTVTEQLSWQIIGISTGQVLITWLVPGLFKRSGVTTNLSTTGSTAFFRELCLQWSVRHASLKVRCRTQSLCPRPVKFALCPECFFSRCG